MRSDTEKAYKERLLRVLIHIQGHLDERLSLDELAGIAHFSPFHFHRIFRGMVGESVKEHIRRLRLERAAHRLKFGDRPVTDIAFEAGYESHEAFTRVFSAAFGVSPSRFRQAHRTLTFSAVPSGVHFSSERQLTDFQVLQSGGRELTVSIRSVDVMRLAFVRNVGRYDHVAESWGSLFAWAGPRGIFGRHTKTIGVVHDDPEVTPPDRIRYDAGLIVAEDVQPEGEVGVQKIGGGDFAVAIHQGPYTALGEIYAKLCGQWLPASGREPRSAPALEIYCNSPQQTAPQDLLTEIYIPVV